PIAVVELANRWRETQLEEEREVERILRRLSADAGARADAIVMDVEVLARIDLAVAKARLGDEMGAHELPYEGEAQGWIAEAPAQLHLLQARHPLLAGRVVPTTITVGGRYRVLLITGGDSCGRAFALGTAALLAMMEQAGLRVQKD